MKHKPLFLRVVATLLALFIGHTGWAEEPARDAASDTASDTETAAFVIPEKSEASAGSDTDARPANDDIFVLDDFVVSAEDDRGYYAANSISATRTNALVKNTPISISVINEQMMEDLNILNDQDLVRATSSVSEDPDGFSLKPAPHPRLSQPDPTLRSLLARNHSRRLQHSAGRYRQRCQQPHVWPSRPRRPDQQCAQNGADR
jgi:hypothetical protein